MNFGKWIIVSFILFALFIGTLVAICVKQDISLVSKNYYQDELVYQEQIKRINNTQELKQKPVFKITPQAIELEFRPKGKVEKGEMRLFCPSNAGMDKKFSLHLSDEGKQLFEIGSVQKGMYRIKLSWTMEDKEFYYEEVIYI